jgi:hypothetical protein
MKNSFILVLVAIIAIEAKASPVDTSFTTPFERSKGMQTATFFEAIDFYKRLADKYHSLSVIDIGISDIGYPLRAVMYTKDGDTKKEDWKREGRLIMLINNDIHPGEPDGVDACMMLLRNAATGKIDVPKNIVLVVIPVYNIGGALNRNSTSRMNQNGPESFGFRGNAKNLDLNRDFIKCDAAETIGFEDLFTKLNPDIFIDNHVSDGADYQHVMTLLASQHDKLGGECGAYMYNTLTPLIYKDMKTKGYDLVPYVNDFSTSPDNGWREFFESPRFSSGYASLFSTLSYVPETHMLKPFKDRVNATYALMQTLIKLGSEHANEIKQVRANDRNALKEKTEFALDWKVDTTRCDSILFRGYEATYITSKVSGLPRLYYDHSKPYTRNVAFYDHYVPSKKITAPVAYIIPKAWVAVISRLRGNGVHMERFDRDTDMNVTAYHIDNYETLPHPYESHYLHKNVQVTAAAINLRVTEGDYFIPLNQPAKRYLVETLEPTGPDAFLAWNFFDGILQQKEYFSDYVFEDRAAQMLEKDPALKAMLEDKRKQDTTFAKNADAQLDFVYRHSAYMEPEYMRYPVYRVE